MMTISITDNLASFLNYPFCITVKYTTVVCDDLYWCDLRPSCKSHHGSKEAV